MAEIEVRVLGRKVVTSLDLKTVGREAGDEQTFRAGTPTNKPSGRARLTCRNKSFSTSASVAEVKRVAPAAISEARRSTEEVFCGSPTKTS
ncbi:MAG: hypothetical protein AAGF23_04680 [Acidobacteriota bacterium]